MPFSAMQKPDPGDLVVDHVAHFVPDLEAAGALLERLGFAPTPVSQHQVSGAPAGTSNRCLMLEAGYVEILAPTHDTPNARRVRGHMARYAGIHLACFGTPDAQGEHQRLLAHGFEPDPVVPLARSTADGQLRFNVVYVPAAAMPEGRVQYCEHLTPELLWKDGAVRHPNGAKGLADVYVVADDPAAAAARWGRFAGLLPRPEAGLVRLDTARGSIFIGTREALHGFIEQVPAGPAIAAFSLRVEDPAAFAARCEQAGCKVSRSARGYCASLPDALGGSWLF